uniref:Pentatricopeptide repeat-containing protein n=1 Tax=Chenopodium quinoa TaxID=63459 RepID=A0A803N784_CHEQI
FTKLGQVHYACQLLDEMPQRNVAPSNAVIAAFSEMGYDDIAFDSFRKMHMLGVSHDNFTFACVLSLCPVVELYGFGRQVHSLISNSRFLGWSLVINSLLTMHFDPGNSIGAYKDLKIQMRWYAMRFAAVRAGYEFCIAISNAAMAMNAKNIVSWNAIISALAQYGGGKQAVSYFTLMHNEIGLKPDQGTFTASYRNVKLGRNVAGLILRIVENNPAVYVLLSYVDANAGQWEDAAQVRELITILESYKATWV